MTHGKSSSSRFVISTLMIMALSAGGHQSLAATQNAESASAAYAAQQRDGAHDFDFLIGDWKRMYAAFPTA